MNDFINMFAQGMGNGSAGQSQPNPGYAASASSGGHEHVVQIQNLQQLQKLIKDTPALAVDFWSPQCPPCMRIKPVFEGYAKSNDNENLKFAAVNTTQARDCCQAFGITSIPQFFFYVAGKQVS